MKKILAVALCSICLAASAGTEKKGRPEEYFIRNTASLTLSFFQQMNCYNNAQKGKVHISKCEAMKKPEDRRKDIKQDNGGKPPAKQKLASSKAQKPQKRK